MRLFPEVIANFSTGCQGWDWHEDAWRPHRLPALMRPLYEQSEAARIRMHATAGVRLRFVSDTTRLWIQLRFGAAARPIFKSELLVDGRPMGGFGPDAFAPQWEGDIYHNIEPRERTYDIWLPNMAQADVLEMQVDDDCFIEPAEPLPLRWLMYGDSITQGMVSSLPTTSVFGIVALACQAEVFNLGIGGAKIIPELATTVPQGHFDVISVAYGSNDFNQNIPVEQYQANTRALLEALLSQFPQAAILLITPLTWATRTEPNANGNHLADFRQSIEPLANLNPRIRLIDGVTLIPDDTSMFVDKVHPNDQGFALYGQRLAQHLKQALAQV